MSEQITKEDETNKLLTQLLTKHDDSLEKIGEINKQNSEAINLLKEQNTKILESIDSLKKEVSEHTSENPVGLSPGISGDKGNAGKKEDAPNALAPDEKDPASDADPPGSDKEGLSGETKKTYKAEDKEEETKKEHDKKEDEKKVEKEGEEKDKKKDEKKMEKDETHGYPDKDKKEEKKMEKGKSLPGSYRSSIDKADADNPQVTSSILKSMTGEGFKEKTVTPQMVKSRTIANITKEYIATKGSNDSILKALPTGGSS